MYSMWNAPSDRDYYDSLGGGSVYASEDNAEVCLCCDARWDLGKACEEWCETNRAALEPAPALPSVTEEQELPPLAGLENAGWTALRALTEVERQG
ncbi:MAG: hypothetical protein LC130_30505 [Bryobacterales bacterium]|nr:hypothetical protein [Bryobacterales bacterium]